MKDGKVDSASVAPVEVERIVSLMRRLDTEGRRDYDRRERAVTELMRESYDNPQVRAYLDAWMGGNYENLEMALCAMAVQLSKENTRLRDCIIKDLETRPQPWERCSNCGDWIHPDKCHYPCNGMVSRPTTSISRPAKNTDERTERD